VGYGETGDGIAKFPIINDPRKPLRLDCFRNRIYGYYKMGAIETTDGRKMRR
jgi:hypothetical protein